MLELDLQVRQVRDVLLAEAGFLGERPVQFPQGLLPFRGAVPSVPAGGKEEKKTGRKRREKRRTHGKKRWIPRQKYEEFPFHPTVPSTILPNVIIRVLFEYQ
jgi:hypothetical protein